MRTNWLLILAMASATTAWPWKQAASLNMVVRRAAYDHDHNLIYVRDSTTASTTTTRADTTTSSTTTSASTTTTASTTSTTSTTSASSTSTTSSTTTATSITSATTTTASTTSSTTITSSASSASSTTTASTTSTTSSTASSSSTSSSTTTLSASAAAELRAWNHAGEIRAIVVFSILGGVALGFVLYAFITSCARKRQSKRSNRLSTAGSSYSVIPLTAEGKDDAQNLRESRMFS